LVYFPNYNTSGVSFVVVAGGSYEIDFMSSLDGNAPVSAMPTLQYTPQSDQAPPKSLTSTPLACVVSSVGGTTSIAPIFMTDTISIGGGEALFTTFNYDVGTPSVVSATSRQVRATWAFTCSQNSLFIFINAVNSSSVTSHAFMRITQIGQSAVDSPITNRSLPNFVVNDDVDESLKAFRPDREIALRQALASVAAYEVDDADLVKVMRKLTEVGCSSPVEANFLIDKLDLPMKKFTTTVAILPALATIASWAVATFGPILADKALRWVQDKIDGGKRVVERKRRK
jgi:hypothetical protein